jgi:hypothetical protein
MKSGDQAFLSWRELLKSSSARWAFTFCFLALLLIIFYLPVFYKDILGPKPGILIHDVVLNAFVPVNWSIPTFAIIYISIVQTFFSIRRNPTEVLIALTAYLGISLLRMAAMYLITFEPPSDMILLVDPVTSRFYPDGGFAKDLFFSGHVSTMTLMVLLEKNRVMRMIKIAGTLTVALFLLWQHVHYSLDILAAPFMASAVYYSVRSLLKPVPKG